MSEQAQIKRIHLIAICGCLFFLIILSAIAVTRYFETMKSLTALHQQKARFGQLMKDISKTQVLVDAYKKEQDEFKKLLFDERDVPTFLDGISASAAKSLVVVVEMKTQKFAEVEIPKDMAESDSKLSRLRVVENKEKNKKAPKEKLNQVLTLAAMPINIKIQGPFEAIVQFLNSIESYRQLLTVSNVAITSRSDYPALTCEFTLKIYSLKKLGDIKA